MEYRRLGNTGLRVSRLALGCMSYGDPTTAPRTVDASLTRLGTDHIDVYQIHRFDPETPVGETMETLHDVVRAGRARYLGASSMFAWQFAKLQHAAYIGGWTPFVSVQNQYNLLRRHDERELMAMCADMGVGRVPYIVRWLNETGVPTVTGARWSSTAVRGILTNPRYVGDLTQGKDRKVIGRGAWQPILKRTNFEALQVVLEERKAYNTGRPPTASLLGGIVRCGRCLSPMTAHASGRASKPYRSYACHRNSGGCGRVVRKQSLVDEYVVPELLSRIDVESLVADREAAAAEVMRVEGVERDLGWRLEDARTAIQEDRLALESGLPILDNLRRQREAARRSLAAARNRLSEAERSTAARERWDTWSLEQKRDWIRSHTSAILIHPTGPGRRDPGVEVRLR